MRRLREAAAIRHLRRGNLLAHATEGVFGLGCRALDADACARLARLKGRSRKKAFIVVAADFSQIAAMVDLDHVEYSVISASWPGPETWVLPFAATAPRWLGSEAHTIAVRVTAHPQFARLCRAVGPMVSTSANLPQRKPALNLLRARHYFGTRVDFYLDGRLLRPGRPSRIRDASRGLSIRE